MAKKLSKEIDKDIAEMVSEYAENANLPQLGVNIKPLAVVRKTKEMVKVAKAAEVTELFAGEQDIVFLYIYEDAFMKLDEATQRILIEAAIATISVKPETGDIVITPPELHVPLGIWKKYGDQGVNRMEAAYYAIHQLEEMEREEKERAKAEKAQKKQDKKLQRYQ